MWSWFRLRGKLVLAFVSVALVSILTVATVATMVVFGSLERGRDAEAQRQLQVGVNLLFRTVEQTSHETNQLVANADLVRALRAGAAETTRWLERAVSQRVASMFEVFAADGQLVSRTMTGGAPERFIGLELKAESPIVQAALDWAHDLTLGVAGERLVIRAAAPIVDATFRLHGVLVMSVPLDAHFADGMKGALGADVILVTTGRGMVATFRDPRGRRSIVPQLQASIERGLAHASRGLIWVDHLDRAFGIAMLRLAGEDQAPIGALGVAVDRADLNATKLLALRTLILGGGFALGFALVMAYLWSRRLNAPLLRLHKGAIAVSRGDLEHQIVVPSGDEIGDLAIAFNHMTETLKENQQRLAARMREIVALHDAGRAVSSVIDAAQVPRKVVDAIARTFDVQLAALWLIDSVEPPRLELRAARSRKRAATLGIEDALEAASPFTPIAEAAARAGTTRRYETGVLSSHAGPLVAMPLERQGRVIGIVIVTRDPHARNFAEADLNLLATFADQAGAAIDNALLYDQVRGASAYLEQTVEQRTGELVATNAELGKTLRELQSAQAQLVLSERLAGLGMLVAGVAHEINSPSAAIAGSVQALEVATGRFAERLLTLAELGLAPSERVAVARFLQARVAQLAARRLLTGVAARVVLKELKSLIVVKFAARGLDDQGAALVARNLADAALLPDEFESVWTLLAAPDAAAVIALSETLVDAVNLHRTGATISDAIRRIARIVGALKAYSHLDQHAARAQADIHDGLETTLTLFDYQLRDIRVERRYGSVPLVSIYVDELNQVWTNLIQNATFALGAYASRDEEGVLSIETAVEERAGATWAVVRIIDNGPGIPADVMPRIFDPFFTTKVKGEGTGLGLGIVRQIVDKHGGLVDCVSRPGHTCFTVALPLAEGAAA